MHKTIYAVWLLPRQSLAFFIAVYQRTISPDHGPLRVFYPYGFCRHEPTCSEHGRRVILERGTIIGCCLLIQRLCSCHPWKKVTIEKLTAKSVL